MKKKKRQKKKSKVPLLYNDDFPFGEGGREEESFVEVFDFGLFEEESATLLQARFEEKNRLVKCSSSPLDELDLHGSTAAQAEVRVDSFILTCRLKGARSVRIITGKGLHSPGQAVLPDVVERLLKAKQHDGLVANYRWENGEKWKSGAVIVCL